MAVVAALGTTAARSVAASGPNLQVSQVSATLSSDQTSIGVGFLITNTGDASSSTFNWAVYFSGDATLDSGDTLLRSKAAQALAPGATVSGPTNVLVPSGTTAGHYCVIVQAPAGAPGTGSTGSACFDIGASPNLVVDSVSAPSSAPPAGGTITVGATVHNVGSGAAAASHAAFYLSTDSSFGGDTLLGQTSVASLAPGATASPSLSVTLPALTPATYWIFAVADSGAEVTETNESDNVRGVSFVVSAPNLVANLLSAPTTVPGVGGSVDVSFTIGNVGNVDAAASHWAIYLSQDTTLSGDDQKMRESTVLPIAAGGASSHITSSVPLPNTLSGPHCILIQADSQNEVPESNENDNIVSACLTVLQAIDLAPTISAPATMPPAGGSAALTVTVANAGNADSGASSLGIYLSSDSALSAGDTRLASVAVGSVPAFSSVQLQPTVTVPALPLGRYYLLAVADDGGAVSESNEGNNVAAAAFDVQAPNLVVQLLQGAVDTPQDGSVPVTFSIKNVGTAAAGASDYSVWLSDDSTLGGDTLLRRSSVAALAANSSSTTVQTSLQLPPGTAAGSHCLLIQADSGAAVTESDETDNVVASCFTALVVDHTPPVTTSSVDSPGTLTGWNTRAVTIRLAATDDNAGVREIHYSVGGSETVVPGASATVVVSAEGQTAVSWYAVDQKGNAEAPHTASVSLDTHAPAVTCSPPAAAWRSSDVTVPCTATDSGSGLAVPGDASFSLATSVPAGSEDAAAATGSRHVCDVAGNCTDEGPFSFQVDRKAPTVTCTPPDADAWHKADVTFTCTVADAGSGPAEGSFTLSTHVAPGTEDAAARTDEHSACDRVNNCTAPISLTAAVDEKPPTVSCPSAGGDWHRADASFDCTVADGGSGPVAPTVRLTAQAPADAETTLSTGTAEACDVAGNCVTAGPVAGVRFDTKAPVISCSPPAQGSWYRADVSVPCTATDGGSGLAAGDASFSLTAAVPAGTASAAVATGPREVCDGAGNCADAPRYEFQIDEQAPQVSCPQPDGAWHAGDVSYACSADDGAGSGLADGADAAFTLATSLPAGQEDAAAPAGSRTVCDLAGNCAAPVSRTAMVDRKAPTVSCPSAGSDWHRTDASFDCTVADGGSGPVASTVRLTAQAPANAETTLSTGSEQACDQVGNCTTAGPIAGVRFDTKAPTFSCDQPDGAWHKGPVSLVCHGQDGGSGLAVPPTLTLTASVADGVEDAAAFTGDGSFCDTAGNCATVPALGPIKLDRKAPTVTCPAADSAWHTDNVTFTCTVSDAGSGPTSATVQLATSVAAGSETANASTAAQQACDAVGNCAPAGPVTGVKVDRKAPSVTIAAPSGVYVIGADVTADYSCADGGSGVALCAGLLPDGAPVDTSRIGTRSFAVAARDAVGHLAAATSSYTVTYGVCVPQGVPRGPVGGKTVRVWLTICDADGRDISSKSMELTAVGVDSGPVPVLPGNRDFHYEQKFGFRYDLDGSRLAAGTHTLRFTIEDDPVVHTVRFTTPK